MEDSILLLSVGELNENKNHKVVIDVLPSLPENIHYIICGTGKLYDEYIEQAKKLNVANRLHLLGYRDDVIKIMKSCDIFIFPSKREGLSVALMEAMACGLPCIVSNIRGNKDLINDNIFEIKDLNKIERLIIKNINMHKKDYPTSVINRIDCKKIMEQMKAIY